MVKKKGNILIVILSILALVGFATAGYFFWQNKNKPSVVPHPPPLETPDEMTNWKTYTNTQYGFLFKYPQDVEIDDVGGDFVSLRLLGPNQPLQTSLGEGIQMDFVLTNQSGKNLLQIATEDRQQYIEGTKSEVSSPTQIAIAGKNGYKTIVTSLDSPYKGLTRIFLPAQQTGKYWQIDQYTPDPKGRGYDRTAGQILSTFKFIDSKTPISAYDLLKNIVSWNVTPNDSGYVFIRNCTDGTKNIVPSGKIETLSYGAGKPETIPPVSTILLQTKQILLDNGWQACKNTRNPDGTTPNETYSKNGKLIEIQPRYSMGVGNSISVQFEY